MAAEIISLCRPAKASHRRAAFSCLSQAVVQVHGGNISEARTWLEDALRHVREAERSNEPPLAG